MFVKNYCAVEVSHYYFLTFLFANATIVRSYRVDFNLLKNFRSVPVDFKIQEIGLIRSFARYYLQQVQNVERILSRSYFSVLKYLTVQSFLTESSAAESLAPNSIIPSIKKAVNLLIQRLCLFGGDAR